MGLLDWFRRKEGPAPGRNAGGAGPAVPRALERNIKRLLNKHLHSEERWGAIQAVAEDPSDAAVDALIRRFGIHVEPSAVDNEEKDYIADALASRGEAIVPRLTKSLRRSESVTWQVRVLGRIVPRDALCNLLVELLGEFDTEYERSPERKIQVVMALAEFPGDEVAKAVARFLGDVNETVRFQAVSTIGSIRGETAREALIELFLRDESVRIRTAVLDLLVETGWLVHGHRGAVEKALPPGYVVDRAGAIRKRPKG